MLRGTGHTWNEVANAIGVSQTTLWHCLTEQNITLSPYVDICDHDLEQMVSRIQHDFLNAGLVMIPSLQSCSMRWFCVDTPAMKLPRPNPFCETMNQHTVIFSPLLLNRTRNGTPYRSVAFQKRLKILLLVLHCRYTTIREYPSIPLCIMNFHLIRL